MEEIELYLEEAKDQMNKAISHVTHELAKIRAGKANPAMLDGIHVSYYGAMSPLNQVSSITSQDARTLFIKPWEKGRIPEIEKAIMVANLGLTPQNDGQQVIINIPMLTEERRKQLVKQSSQECEQGKVSIRSIRKDTNDQAFQPLAFVPHVAAGSPLAAETPVVIGSRLDALPHEDVLINLGDALAHGFGRFDLVIEIVGPTDEERQAARGRYRRYKEQGLPLSAHDLAQRSGE